MDKERKEGYVTGGLLLVFGILIVLSSWSQGITTSNLALALGLLCLIGGGGSIWKPDTVGQVVSQIMKNAAENQQRASVSQKQIKTENSDQINAGGNVTINKHYLRNSGNDERRKVAIERIWENEIELRKFAGAITLFYDIVLPNEYLSAAESQHFKPIFSQMTEEKITEGIFERNIEKERPFVSEEAWNLFEILRTLYGRAYITLIWGIKDQKITRWQDDELLINKLQTYLSNQEIIEIKNMKTNSFTHTIKILENRLLLKLKEPSK